MKHSACSLFFILFINSPIIAQVDSTENTNAITLNELFQYSLDELLEVEVTTGSNLSDVVLYDIPGQITVITKEDLELSNARHLSEALEIYVPGFQYMYNKWNGMVWGMRGTATDRNTKFIFLVNGHKMNLESRGGNMTELDLGLMGDIERIEIVRGQSGLVHGSGAIAGAVNIITKNYKDNNIEVRTDIRTWNMKTVGSQFELLVNQNIKDDASIVLSLGYRKSQGQGAENGRIMGKPTWPYPTWLNTDYPQHGVPNSGSTWSTPGNFKGGLDLRWKKLRLYTRASHQVTNA
ncbi:MAG: TonB-dependent receptor plug domain-containing protein [Reichenbachiella sp.]